MPLILIAASAIGFAATALATGQSAQLSADGVIAVLERVVALGLVALGQTFVILAPVDRPVGRQPGQRRRGDGVLDDAGRPGDDAAGGGRGARHLGFGRGRSTACW